MATARAAFSGATTAGRSISGRWMAWGSKPKAAWRTLQFPMTGTFRAPATSTATATTTFSGATTADRSTSGRWMARRSKPKAVSCTLQFPTTGTSKASATSMLTGRATFYGVTTAGRSISGRWMAWESKTKAAWRTRQSPTTGTSKASATFDGDGKSDLLWRHDSGAVYIWEMNGLGIKAEGGVVHAAVPNDWHILGLGDFDGDGKSGDILWRHDSGQVYIWEMNGLGITAEGGAPHAPVPSDWHIFSQHNFV